MSRSAEAETELAETVNTGVLHRLDFEVNDKFDTHARDRTPIL